MLHAVVIGLALLSGAAPSEGLAPIDVSLTPGARALPVAEALPTDTAALWRDGRVSSVDARYGVPTFFWAPRAGKGALRDMGLTAEQAARRHLLLLAPLYRLSPNQLLEARLAALHDVGQGAIVARFELPYAGVKIFRDELKLVLDRSLELVAVGGALSPDRKPLGTFDLLDTTALSVAFSDLTGRALEAGQLGPARAQVGGYTLYSLAGQSTPPRVRTVYFPTPGGLEPAYHLELQVSEADSTDGRYAAYVVSARDGKVLFRQDLTRADGFSYRVWADAQAPFLPSDGPHGNAFSPHPTGTPSALPLTFVAPSLVTLPNAGLSTNDPWLAPDAVDTRGNNASAYADLASPNGLSSGDVLGTLTGPLAFDRVYDTGLNPTASVDQVRAAVTQLFYNVNVFHDWYYDVGFDEKAGNGQKSNLGRGGLGNDALEAQAQDYSGRNNANMSTPSDGAAPQMQMYVFDGGEGAKVVIPGVRVYRTGTATFGPATFVRSAQVVLVDDASGVITDGCQPNFNNVAGKIVLIDRGTCTFAAKVVNAQNNGAVGVIIGNNQGGAPPDLPGPSSGISIPALSISRTDAQDLKARLLAGTVTVTLDRPVVVDRDGTIDNAIVAHEWGHYISNRLIGDANGLANNQGVGMGEGWADFHALLMIVKEGDRLLAGNDQFQGVYPMAVYTSEGLDPLGTYFGIRRVPYSTDFTKNAYTFKHVQDRVPLPAVPTAYGQNGADNSEVHSTGEVWATMLWECYTGLLRDSRYTFAQAQDRMKRYLVAGYKLTPVVPTMVEARDALLAAAAATDLQDFATFSAAFARRGMGQKAVAPDRDSTNNTPVVESFLTGNAVEIAGVTLDDGVQACDNDAHLDANETGLLTVRLKNVGVGALSAPQVKVSTTTPGLTFKSAAVSAGPLSPFGTTTVAFEVSMGAALGEVGATFDLEVSDATLPANSTVKQKVGFRLNYDTRTSGATTDDVEAPMTAWRVSNDPNGNTTSDFRRLSSSPTATVWFGPNPSSPADTRLISPALQVASDADLVVTFRQRYDFEGDPAEYFDGAVVELSSNGGTSWTDVGAGLSPGYAATLSPQGSNPLRGRKAYSGQSAGYPAFFTTTLNLGRTYAGKTVLLRFRIGSDDAAAKKGWELDDFDFKGITNAPFTSVVPDPNSCTNRVPVASAPAEVTVTEGQAVTLEGTATDADGDALTLTWTQVSGAPVTLAGAAFEAPQVTQATALLFELTAFDGKARSAPVRTQVTVLNQNTKPTVALADLEVVEGDSVTLPAVATDVDGDAIVGWRWLQILGPTATLSSASAPAPTFTAPEVPADQRLLFVVAAADGEGFGPTTTVTVLVKNKAQEQGRPQSTPLGACSCGEGGGLLAPGLALLSLLMRRRRPRS